MKHNEEIENAIVFQYNLFTMSKKVVVKIVLRYRGAVNLSESFL